MEEITARKLTDNMISTYELLSNRNIDMPKRWFFQICAAIFYTIYRNLKQELLEEIKNDSNI